jgi:hypothetical protein
MITPKESVDALIEQFWQNGYLTLSRKFGTYLPAPKKVGEYEIDAVARYKQKIAIGISLTEEELNDPKIISKLSFLSSRNSDNQSNKITLFVGVPAESLSKAKIIVSGLDEKIKKNIKVVPIFS